MVNNRIGSEYMRDTEAAGSNLNADLEQINAYLIALSQGEEPPELDLAHISEGARATAETARVVADLVDEERTQAELLSRGDFGRPAGARRDNPLTASFDGIRENLAAPYNIACGVATGEWAFSISERNNYLKHLKSVVHQLRDQRIQLETEAYSDSLTGLGNRAAYKRDLDHVWVKHQEHTVAFIDVDGLKFCNDHFGHMDGNQYILQVANHLNLHRHPDERLYRIGGDEFLLLSLNDSAEEMTRRLEACRSSLGAMVMEDGQTPYSFSFGCAHANPLAGDSRHEMIAEADRRMYDYKLTNGARVRMRQEADGKNRSLENYAEFRGVQDRIFQAMALTSVGRYLFVCNVDTDQSHWSRNAVKDFDLPAENMYQMDKVWSQHIHPDDVDEWSRDIDDIMAGRKHHHNMRYRAKDASGHYVMVTCAGVRLDGDGKEPTLFVGSISNSSLVESTDPATGLDDVRALVTAIGERKTANTPTDIIAFKFENIDRINTIYGYEAGNDALTDLTGRILSRLERTGRLFRSYGLQFVLMFDAQPDMDLARIAENVRHALAQPVTVQNVQVAPVVHVVYAHYPTISAQPLSVLSDLNRRIDAESRSVAPAPMEAGRPVSVAQDRTATERRDKMTGLMRGNDFLYAADLHRSVHAADKRAVVAIDLGRMRVFNEWYGRQAGDALIAEVGNALQALEAMGVGFAGYWGQDDFVAYIPGDRTSIEELYQRISEIVSSRDDSIGFLPAFGVCPVGPGDRIDMSLYDRAKSALEQARNDFKDRIKFFKPETYAQRENEHRLLSAFQRALGQNKIEFHVQPQCNINTKKIVGGEALARWKRDDGSYVSPGVFVPLLERNGFVVTLDRHIWNLTFAWLSKRLAAGLPCVPISINVSQTDLISLDVADHLDRLAVRYGVPTRYIKVEITESAFAEDPDAVSHFTEKLHALGFAVFIDDFGSGSSSLSMLQTIDADVIKLDGRFMSFEPTAPGKAERASGNGAVKSENIVESVVNMAWNIGMPVVVEGVETAEQVDFLSGLGCRYVQGFYYYRPMPVANFEHLISDPDAIDPAGITPPNQRRGGAKIIPGLPSDDLCFRPRLPR